MKEPGDANGDEAVNIIDISSITDFIYHGGDAPSCIASTDPNNNGVVNMLDLFSLTNYLYKSGPAPICGHA
ncbi:hypothetical protein TRIP_C20032 [Candidatus Zixiibacteriota bacterium]|nr:hypothetical protein TRIP_C20032 [candidate division Zixibacteria bacterium]